MSTTTQALPGPGFLARERTIAGPGFSRWLVPPAALAIHLCIGMAYGFSVFWLPLAQAVGVTKPLTCPKEMTWIGRAFTTSCDWTVAELGWTFTLFFIFLGSAAALWGGWVERAGPRKTGAIAAVCWCGGLIISSFGVTAHQEWLLWLGAGVIGGIGLGLGYISPVSTLIKWFPDHRGVATGLAIMGFGGGAMIGSPLAQKLMQHYATPTSVGVAQTLLTLAVVYFIFMIGGALSYRLPADGWRPAGWDPSQAAQKALVTDKQVHLSVAWKTPQFWQVWAVLCLNVTAGIGILAMASPLLQEVFGGKLLGVAASFDQLTTAQKTQIAAIAAAFTGLLSLFNIAGRIFWASLSDKIGRKATYFVFFVLGTVLYASVPGAAATGSLALFVAIFCVALSMYGGGFSTVPAYLADLFGTRMVGAIHGRLLTAWSVAGVLGPVLVNYIRQYQLDHGVPKAQAYSITMYILAAILVVGFIFNWLVKPTPAKYQMTPEQLAATDTAKSNTAPSAAVVADGEAPGIGILIVLAWLAVWVPIAWGVWVTLEKALPLFK
ncbi:MAG TPA: OFA family MFS transporter [Steroidobacteraceae bacterium]|jgi:MFS family permease